MNINSFPELVAYKNDLEIERFPARAPRSLITLREAAANYVANGTECELIGKLFRLLNC